MDHTVMDFLPPGFTNILGAGAILGVLAGFWNNIKSALWRVANLVVQQIEIPSEAAHSAIISYLVAKYPRSRFYDRMYGADYEHLRDGRYGLIPYEQFGHRSVVFWCGRWPFVFTNAQENKAKTGKQRTDNSYENTTTVYCTVTFLRGTVNVEEIVREACNRLNNQTWEAADAEDQAKNRFVIHHVPTRDREDNDHNNRSNGLPWYRQNLYRLLNHTPDQLGKGSTYGGKALENLIFPRRVKDLISEIELWRGSRKWYQERAIPWKRGWMLYGPPGTGKTALARAFAEDLNMPIYVFNLAEVGNYELVKAWTEMQVNVPCIALIEDIDNVFHGRENVTRKGGGLMPFFMGAKKEEGHGGNDRERGPAPILTPLTFDCLLNCLDGVERADGVFTIITTNDISKIDPALGQPRKLPDGATEFISTRPGRIDKAIELTYMEPADKKRMAVRILAEYAEPLREMLEFVDHFPDLQETPAQFQERCAQVALACFWREKRAAEAALRPEPVARPDGTPADADRVPRTVG